MEEALMVSELIAMSDSNIEHNREKEVYLVNLEWWYDW